MVGAGVVGLSIALFCAQRGWRVTILERNAARRDGCSYGNTGLIVPSHFVPLAAPGVVGQGLKWMLDARSPFYIAPRPSWDLLSWLYKFWRACNAEHVRRAAPCLRDLIFASRACYDELAGGDDVPEIRNAGTLMLCKTQHALQEEAKTADMARALGMRAEVLDAAQTAAVDPAMQMDVIGSVYFPQDASIVPEQLMASLQTRAAQADVRFAWNREVTGWRTESNRVCAVRLDGSEEIDADEFVLAAGVWSSALSKPLRVELPMQAGKGYSLTLSQPRHLPSCAAILVEARAALSPLAGALRVGGTMELTGLESSVNGLRVRSIVDAIPRYYPALTAAEFDGVRPWHGLRPCSPDGLPYLGRTGRYANLTIATGHAMLGVSLGPITGKIVAQLLAGEQPPFDLTLLSPDRYH